MDVQILIVVSGAFFTILLLSILIFGESKQSKIRQTRLSSLHNLRTNQTGGQLVTDNTGIRKQQQDSSKFFHLLQRYMPKKKILERKLQQTGKMISIGQFALILIIAILVSTFLALLIGQFGLFVSILIGLSNGTLLPLLWVRMMAEKRKMIFLRDFPDAIDLMVRGLRSGLPVSEGIKSVGREFSGPIKDEFQKVMDEVQFGTDLEAALWMMAERVPAPDVKFFVITLSIQKDTGGNLAETLMNLSNILRSRKQMLLKVKALSSEAKASAMILGSLPFVLFGILSLLSPDYIFMLFEDPRGHKMVAVGGGLIVIGVLIMRKMVKFKM